MTSPGRGCDGEGMKKKVFSVLALCVLLLLSFSACSLDQALDALAGNKYIEWGIAEVDTSASDAAVSMVSEMKKADASSAVSGTSVDVSKIAGFESVSSALEKAGIDTSLNVVDSNLAAKIAEGGLLQAQSEEEKTALNNSLSQALAGTASREALPEPWFSPLQSVSGTDPAPPRRAVSRRRRSSTSPRSPPGGTPSDSTGHSPESESVPAARRPDKMQELRLRGETKANIPVPARAGKESGQGKPFRPVSIPESGGGRFPNNGRFPVPAMFQAQKGPGLSPVQFHRTGRRSGENGMFQQADPPLSLRFSYGNSEQGTGFQTGRIPGQRVSGRHKRHRPS